ncbi:hypothetical protein [Pseudomonas sp. 5P_3.1_Bac2]|uniref:hypothetical protein n=1 Tax=Pseudomonas sp. 5P_3.1_Bac2 TaxID=2971617 RepID=UPI0021C99C5B|nr:hypothetical protein [Pseudomonas sp. 5P_3.1_Bac2]MCU1718674.1 hypothetical protein [Pseudomonas sp. 5P_3.1_Bac2]
MNMMTACCALAAPGALLGKRDTAGVAARCRSSGYSSEQQLCRLRLPDDAANNSTDAPPALQSFGLDSPERTA